LARRHFPGLGVERGRGHVRRGGHDDDYWDGAQARVSSDWIVRLAQIFVRMAAGRINAKSNYRYFFTNNASAAV
jgi:hypothetical protein